VKPQEIFERPRTDTPERAMVTSCEFDQLKHELPSVLRLTLQYLIHIPPIVEVVTALTKVVHISLGQLIYVHSGPSLAFANSAFASTESLIARAAMSDRPPELAVVKRI
jgi:hypothetical protein